MEPTTIERDAPDCALTGMSRSPWSAALMMLAAAGALALPATSPASQTATAEQTRLEREASTLRPGEFRKFEAPLPDGYTHLRDLFRVAVPDGRRLAIDDWIDGMHWDPNRKMLLFLGLRLDKKFIAYDAKKDRWEVLGWDGDPPVRQEAFGHAYSRNALDAKRGHYYHLSLTPPESGERPTAKRLHRYEIDSRTWVRLPDLPSSGYPTVATKPIEWHDALDMLIVLDSTSPGHTLRAFDGKQWSVIGRARAMGHHAMMHYNPIRRDMLIGGGDGHTRTLDILDDNGQLKPLPDTPFVIAIQDGNFTYNPSNGNYVYLDAKRRQIWELDKDLTHWRRSLAGETPHWPFDQHGSVSATALYETNAVILLQSTAAYVYRAPATTHP